VDTPNGPLTASGRAPEPLGSAVTVLVRPAAARSVSATDEDSGLLSRVHDVAYRGHGYDHLVELADGTRLAGVFAEQRHQRGQEVRVRLDPGGCFAYQADAST
jgi:hypothetical protein